MESQMPVTFTIRRAFIGSLAILLGVLIALAVVCVVQGQAAIKIGLLGCILLVLATVLAASLFRRLEVDDKRVVLHRPGRARALAFADITALEALTMRKRVFLTLCAGEDFIILSNAYGRFEELLNMLLARVPAQSISDEARSLAAAPPRRHADIWSCWLAIALVLVILWHQLATGG